MALLAPHWWDVVRGCRAPLVAVCCHDGGLVVFRVQVGVAVVGVSTRDWIALGERRRGKNTETKVGDSLKTTTYTCVNKDEMCVYNLDDALVTFVLHVCISKYICNAHMF